MGTQQQMLFNQLLYDTDDVCIHIPLLFFMNKSLCYINIHASLLPVQKTNTVNSEKKSVNVLRIEDLTPILGEELSIDYSLHSKVTGNLYCFQKS